MECVRCVGINLAWGYGGVKAKNDQAISTSFFLYELLTFQKFQSKPFCLLRFLFLFSLACSKGVATQIGECSIRPEADVEYGDDGLDVSSLVFCVGGRCR